MGWLIRSTIPDWGTITCRDVALQRGDLFSGEGKGVSLGGNEGPLCVVYIEGYLISLVY